MTQTKNRVDTPHSTKWAVCLNNGDGEYDVDLKTGRLYELMPDAGAEAHQQVRIIDESGEDYLYPAHWFVKVEIADPVRQALSKF